MTAPYIGNSYTRFSVIILGKWPTTAEDDNCLCLFYKTTPSDVRCSIIKSIWEPR